MNREKEKKVEVLYVHNSVLVAGKKASTLEDSLANFIEFDGEILITHDDRHTNEYCAYVGPRTKIILGPKIGGKITIQHGAYIGKDCKIEAKAVIGYVARVGNGATVSRGATLAPHSMLDPGVTLEAGELIPTSTALTEKGELIPLRTHKI